MWVREFRKERGNEEEAYEAEGPPQHSTRYETDCRRESGLIWALYIYLYLYKE